MFFDLDSQTVKDVEALRAFAVTKKKSKDEAPIDDFQVHYRETSYVEMTDAEIRASVGKVLMYDVECFKNYFLVAFRCVESGKVILLEQSEEFGLYMDRLKLAYMMNNFCIVGFNSRNYDLLMCTLAMRGATCKELHEASFAIIINNMFAKDFEIRYDVKIPYLKHIDLIEVAPLSASLKTYAGRLHCKRMQDLPAEINAPLTYDKMIETRTYCLNDLCNTELLCNDLSPQLTLRRNISDQYGVNVMSKSDAQLAESVIAKELERITGSWPQKVDIPVGKAFFYRVPNYLQYANPVLQQVLDVVRSTPFVVESSGYFTMPEAIANIEINIGACTYRMGMGGLHSSEKSVVHKADEDTLLLDRDVVSYYPRIILNQQLYPHHLGKHFLHVYSKIVDKRVNAKKEVEECENILKAKGLTDVMIAAIKSRMKTAKITAGSLKITINGSFGKLGNPYSCLYSPDLMIQVTVSGQLNLLLLIDMLEWHGIHVVSANTDGVVINCPKSRYADLEAIIKQWEYMTGFETEETQYKAIYSRDVNNYIGVTTSGKVKQKGTYAYVGSAGNSPLSRNPENFICIDALVKFLVDAVPIEQTVTSCRDITRFVTVRNVRGGAVKSGEYLGKCIRWYVSTEMKGEINYLTSGNKVPNSDHARPLMELPEEFPADIDYQFYINKTTEMLSDIGVLPKPESISKRRKKKMDWLF